MGYEPTGQADRSHQWGQWVVRGGHWWVGGRPFGRRWALVGGR